MVPIELEGWVGPKAGLIILEKREILASAGILTPNSPAWSLVSIRTVRKCGLCAGLL